ALNYWKLVPEELLVVHDDLDLPPGTARLKFDGGHGGQNGLRDIMAQLGHGRFHRLRIGIGHPGDRNRVTPWVLGNPSTADEDAMLDAIAHAMTVLPLAVAGDFNEATKRLHTPRDPEPGTRAPD
ncbi:MAG: aminoacyl-tRNA hydrolase, partial [Xanthomonadaceae bacterium]|nr:aminoacyl-tRNA hydrolase [Xanthomonadaceae bacterium]